MMKKWFAMLLALVLCVGLATAAQAATEVANGTCSSDGNVKWTLDSDGVLTISGSGKMTNYSSSSSRPWDSNQVMAVVVEEGVESIGTYAFSGYTNLATVTINGKLSSIGSNAFSGCTNLETVTINEGLGTIGSSAFSGCTNLETVTIKGDVNIIGLSAFSRCTSLTTFTYEGKDEPNGTSTAFAGCAQLGTVNVPAGYTSDTFLGRKVTYMPDSGGTTYSVTVAEGIENGAVTAEPTSAEEGEIVTLTVAPDNQYSLKELSASDASGSVTLTQVEGEENQYTFTMPASDVTVTAAFARVYTITYVLNGGEIKNDSYPTSYVYGEGAILPQNVSREGYKFKGWYDAEEGGNGAIQSFGNGVSGDLTFYARWEPKTFTVTWLNEDGTVLETDENVPYGTTPTYDGATPTKEANAQCTYTFAGWDPEVSAITGKATYKATYTSTARTYTITYVLNGGEIKNDSYPTSYVYGEGAILPQNVSREGYKFKGWYDAEEGGNGAIQSFGNGVSGDLTFYARWEPRTFTVTWLNEDGTVLETDENVPYGTTPTYDSATPTKADDGQNTYTFAGWTPEVSAITGKATYKATYTSTAQTYTITYVLNGGTINVEYATTYAFGDGVSLPQNVTREGYNFAGWHETAEGGAVIMAYGKDKSGDITVYAHWKPKTFTVIWQNWDGTVLETDTDVPYGTTPAYDGATPTKADDGQNTYTFAGWTPEVATVTGSATYTATYNGGTKTYTISFDANGGTVSPASAKTTLDGKLTELPEPARSGYIFDGWFTEVDGGTKVAADTVFEGSATIFAHWTYIPVPPTIDGPTEDTTVQVFAGQTAQMTVTAQNAATYQWFVDRKDGAGFVPYTGSELATHTTEAVQPKHDGFQYYCLVTNADGSVKSPVFTLRVLSKVDLPQTGDNSQLGLWLALCLISSTCLLAIILQDKKRKTN